MYLVQGKATIVIKPLNLSTTQQSTTQRTVMLRSGQLSTLQRLFSRNVNLETAKNNNLSYQISVSLQQSPKHVSLVQGKPRNVSNT